MVVEFIGLPGSGKTTLRNDLLARLKAMDDRKYLSSEEAFLQASCRHMDKVFRYPLRSLPRSWALRFARKLRNRSIMQFDAQNRFLSRHGSALEAFLSSETCSNMNLDDRKKVIASFLEMGSLRECTQEVWSGNRVVIFEEGLVQKSFMFVDHSGMPRQDIDKVHSYLANIPMPDLVVYVQAGLSACLSRMMSRPDGLTERLKKKEPDRVQKFLEVSHDHLQYVSGWINTQCRSHLIEVDNNSNYESQIENLISRITTL